MEKFLYLVKTRLILNVSNPIKVVVVVCQKRIGFKKILIQKKAKNPKNVGTKKLGPKKSNKLRLKKLGSKYLWVKKNVRSKKNLSPANFG